MKKPILVGAVIYDPRVSIIWDIIREFFETNGCPHGLGESYSPISTACHSLMSLRRHWA